MKVGAQRLKMIRRLEKKSVSETILFLCYGGLNGCSIHDRYTSLRCPTFTMQTIRMASWISYSTRYTPHRNRYFSDPESLRLCGGRGFLASSAMSSRIRRTSRLGMGSKSLRTDLRKTISYFAIALELLHKVLELDRGLIFPGIENPEVFCVLG